jgi:adenylate cyclase
MNMKSGGLYVLLVGSVIAGSMLIRHYDPFIIQGLRLIAFDTYQRFSPRAYDPQMPVRIVDIDERSLAELGQWPWPRTVIRDLVDKLRENGAAAIAFDVQFSEPDRTSLEEVVKRMPPAQAAKMLPIIDGQPTNDQLLAAALKEAPSVLAVALAGGDGKFPSKMKAGFSFAGDDPRPFIPPFTTGAGNLEILEEAASGIGSINWRPDRDQVLRRVGIVYRVDDRFVPTLFAEALRIAQGASSYLLKSSNASGETALGQQTGLNHIRIGAIEIPTDADGGIWLKFRHSRPEAYLPVWKVLKGEIPKDEIEGRIILIGTSAPGLLDLRATPLDSSIAGVEIIAQSIEHVLSGITLTRPDYAYAIEQFVIVVFGVLLALLLVRVSARAAGLLGLLAIETLLFGGWLAYSQFGLLLDPVFPALSLLCLVAVATFYVYRRVEVQRGEIRGAFSRYVAPAVVNELLANPEKLELGGEERDLTLLFCDVRNFTTISEGLSAHELTRFINELLTPLTDIILSHRGTIDKYMGDAIMAFWNAPLDEAEHATQACKSAIDMAGRMASLNEYWQTQAKAAGRTFDRVRIGIGINTGRCCVGNLGSLQRFDYSAIGDNVNVASRFEGLAKVYGLTAIVGERTINEMRGFTALELDLVRVKGRGRPSPIFTFSQLLHDDESLLARLRHTHNEFLAHFRAQEWQKAEQAIAECRSYEVQRMEHYYALFQSRIADFKAAPPPNDWDGVFTAHEK